MPQAEQLCKFVAPEYVFGQNAHCLCAQYARNLGAQRILVVTDSGVQEAGWTREIVQALKSADLSYVVYDKVTPNPRDHEVMEGVDVYRSKRCNFILAVGGGSPIDCAKGIGIVSTNHGHILDFEGVDQIKEPFPPLICVPTTAGSAADVSQFAIITNTKSSYKIAIISKTLVPDVSIIDPLMTTTMDESLTACTGLDAFAHAAEALASNAHSPITDLHALEAIRLVSNHLKGAVSDPSNMKDHTGMMLASLQAGLAFSNASLGAVHAMAHSMGGLKDLPHGHCNALLLSEVMRFNFDAARKQYERLGTAMGLDLEGLSPQEREEVILNSIEELKQTAGIDGTLSELGIQCSDIPDLAARAMRDACIVTNPRVPMQGDLEVMFEQLL